jgi:Arc/MetJ family transcription regulator
MRIEGRSASGLRMDAHTDSMQILRPMVKRTSLNLELDLVAEARKVLGTRGTTDTIHRALEDVVRRERLRALADDRFDDLTPDALARLRRWRT